MKTLKQRFKKWETISYTQEPNHIPTLIALDEVKKWLQEHQQRLETIQHCIEELEK